MSENQEQTSGQDQENVQPCCEGGSCCPSGSSKGSQRGKIIAFILIVVAAGAVLANSLIRKSLADADRPEQAFASFQIDNTSESSIESGPETDVAPITDEAQKEGLTLESKTAPALWKTELASLSSLNEVATGADAVFVLLGSQGQQANKGIAREMEAALVKIKSNGTRVSTFWLQDSAPEYANLAKQTTFPCVIAMVKGGSMSVVSDEISETKLVQAFVAASRPSSGCGPAGCGPAGCN